MRQELCVSLVAGSWFLCCIHALLHTLLLIKFFLCGQYHPQLLLWPHSPLEVELFRHLPQWVGHLYCGRNPFHPAFESILGLSILTGTSFLRISSTKRLFKVFSTCVTHLFVVYLYYSILASVYFFSSSWDSDDKNTIASIMYAVVTPLLNPFIYSLRYRDIKQALEIGLTS